MCVSLVLDIPKKDILEADEIKSIDEAKEVFQPRNSSYFISPEEEFKGHCSNIQAFFEYGLNTDILDSTIAFPLLRKLVDLGYEPAKRVFNEEIAKRYIEGTYNSRKFLREEGYLNYLTKEEIEVLNIPNPLKSLTPEEINEIMRSEELKKEKFLEEMTERIERMRLRRKETLERLRKERKAKKEQNAVLSEKFNKEWLKKEFGENNKLFVSIQENLKERRERELRYLAERQKKKEAERKFVEEHKSKRTEKNYLNYDPSWGQPDPPSISCSHCRMDCR